MGEYGIGCYGFIVTSNVMCWVWRLDGLLDIVSRHDVGCIASSDWERFSYVFDVGMKEIGAVLFEIYWPQFDFTWFSEVD